MSEHSPEPWQLVDEPSQRYIQDSHGRAIAHCTPLATSLFGQLNARRIVAAVNACKGMPTELLESLTRLGLTCQVKAIADQ